MGRKPLYTVEELQQKVNDFFDYCKNTQVTVPYGKRDIIRSIPPTMARLALFLDMHPDTLYSYINCEVKGEESQQYSEIVARARRRIEAELLEGMLTGSIDPRAAAPVIARFGYSNKAEGEDNATLKVVFEGMDKAQVDRAST